MTVSSHRLPSSDKSIHTRWPIFLRKVVQPSLVYIVLSVGMIFVLLPFIWMISSALKPTEQVVSYTPQLIPSNPTLENFIYVLTKGNFLRFFLNSFIICACTITGHLVSGSIAAYGFARLRFPGRNVLFMLLLSTMMIPYHAYMIPRFMIIKTMGLYDTLAAIFLPYLFGGPLYIFLMRQYFMTLPTELDDAARMDGCNTFQIYALILLPLAKPVLVTVGVLEFLAAWTSFLEPLIYLSTSNNFTVAIGLTLFQQGFGGNIQWGPLMAATTLSALPPLIVCFAAQKYILGGIAATGIKG